MTSDDSRIEQSGESAERERLCRSSPSDRIRGATYSILRTYTTDVLVQKDDGNYGGLAYSDEQEVRYFIDYFNAANGAFQLQ